MRNKLFYSLISIVAVALAAFALLYPTIGAAQSATPDIPDLVGYQGRLTNASGNPLMGTYEITFCLYNQPSGGSNIWCETETAVSVTDGVFSADLGSTNPLPQSVFDTPSLYLGIEVESDGEMTPRVQVMSNGYAYTAANADTLDGMHASDLASASHNHHTLSASDGDPQTAVFVDEVGEVGIGTTDPWAKLLIEVDGSAGWTEPLSLFDNSGTNVQEAGGLRIRYHGTTGEVRIAATRGGYSNPGSGGKFLTFYTNEDSASTSAKRCVSLKIVMSPSKRPTAAIS